MSKIDIYKNWDYAAAPESADHIKLQNKYDNVYIFDFGKFLCNKKKCNNYAKEKNLILYADAVHLSKEAGIYISSYFNEWLNTTFRNEF